MEPSLWEALCKLWSLPQEADQKEVGDLSFERSDIFHLNFSGTENGAYAQ